MSLASKGVDTILHLGDFGVWGGSDGAKYRDAVERACTRFNVKIYVTPGNHENYDLINGLEMEDRGGEIGAVQWFTDHVALLPRGHRWAWKDRTFVSLGGAPSVDFEYRVPGRDWWIAEMITWADVARTVGGGQADVMLAHDAPAEPWQTSRVAEICRANPQGWSADALAYAAVGRKRLTAAFLGVQPRVFAHGHFHTQDEANLDFPNSDRQCRVVSLACDGERGNVALLDLTCLAVTWP
jgi:hypothetical protein